MSEIFTNPNSSLVEDEKHVQITTVQEVTGPNPLKDYELLDQIGAVGWKLYSVKATRESSRPQQYSIVSVSVLDKKALSKARMWAGLSFRINSGMGLSRFKGFGALEMVYPAFWSGNLDCRQISQLVKSNKKRLFLVDTLALVRKLERQGVPLNQPEAITAAITQIEMIQESSLSKFKSQVQSSQGNYFSLLQHETVKLHNDIEKMRSELRYELTNLQRGSGWI